MRFSKPFHLVIAILFLFQTVLPVNLMAATPAADSQVAGPSSSPPDQSSSSLTLETAILAEICSEMNTPLRNLHERYPEQIALWNTLRATLQDSDPRKTVFTQQAGTTGAILSALIGYSAHFDTLQQQFLSRIKTSPNAAEGERDLLIAQLYTLLQLQEKINSYELLAQTHLLDIHLLARTINATIEQKKIIEKIEGFETYRKQQIKQFLTVREAFEQVRKGFALLNRSADETNLAPIRQEVSAYRELAARLTAGRQENASGPGHDVLAKLEQIASNRQRDLDAILAVLSEGREGVSWPILFQPDTENKTTGQQASGFSPDLLLSNLEDMRTALAELAAILGQRNRLLLDSSFLKGDDMIWLTAQIELENLRLSRLSEIMAATDPPAPRGDDRAYQQRMISWEELGLLKEDILAIEAVILNELTVNLDNEALVTDASWQPVLTLLHQQNRWRIGWADIAASFSQVVDGYKTFQAQLLLEKLQAIKTLRADIDRLHNRFANQQDSPLASFFTLIDEALAEQQEETRRTSDLKADSQQQEQDDPLFSHFFGLRSERFFHDFKYMGIALWDHAPLTDNLARIRAHLLALGSTDMQDNRQALLILQLADHLGVIDHIDYDSASCTVHLRSAAHAMVLEGCGLEAPPELRSASLDRTDTRPLMARHLIRSLFCFAAPAHAGAYEQFTGWSGSVFNQMKKNWVNYAVTGVVLAGAVVAAPVAAAVGATAATVTAVTAVATTTALGAKAAFYAQASADIALGTSRHTINQMDFTGNEYATKKNFNTALDVMETTYNIAKVAEGVKNLVNPGQSVEEVAEQVNKARQATQAEQLSYLERMGDLQQTADKVRRQINAIEDGKELFLPPQQFDDLMRHKRHLSELEGLIRKIGKDSAEIGKKGAELIERIKQTNPTEFVSNLSRLGQRVVEGTGLPSSLSDSAEGVKNLTKDSDGDGTPDTSDLCPGDPLKTAPGVCGCNTSDKDSDGDGTPDCKQGASGSTTQPGQEPAGQAPTDEEPPDEEPPADDPPDEGTTGDTPPGETEPDEDSTGDAAGEPGETQPQDGAVDEGTPDEQPPDAATPSDETADEGQSGDASGEASDAIDTLRNADNQSSDSTAATTGMAVGPLPDATLGSAPGGWTPSAPHVTDAERGSAASTGSALSQLNADRQRMETAYQSGQTENQRQSAESMAQIDRQRSTQMVDAIVGGITSGVAQGVGTLGERIGQGAGTRIAQDTGLVDRHPKPPAPGQDGEAAGHCHSDNECPAGSTCDSATETCVQQDTASKSYRGSWSGNASCTANYGSRGTGTCPWRGSIQMTLHPNGSVSGTVTGGGLFNFDDDGRFTSCGGYSESSRISGSHSNGSFSASSSGGARITGSYTDTSITGTTSKAGTSALSGGRTMNCRASGSISLSR